ncbi:hypothetical protein HYPSUDRAFT_202595 [Hypholoma sublateritium FD-334 SS-4]|uniref:GmrSD restriction endonucleases N-terminal domain-containing protein n=1 Tax=Hypholoma sublateritium (strain FD-334 SS-4) TaxID=945553 RepID=A0A0D2PPR7_HYPSF|nr:hypothetical protein HYPSUDRAFT_202590 [Hypholoma sublateritium FD-334 SS-4]KJA21900.1 hypothetical protein HYPSUDRAFT_202595 [Hypholoma sublateritium FD-334 SS-4]
MPSLNDNVNASGISEATTKPDTRRKQVRPPRFTTYSMSSIYAWLQDDLVTFNPDYQQSVAWTNAKQVGLINSLFNNYYIAPIIFSVKRDLDGGEIRVCIDGQHRLRSIQRFMLGEISSKNDSPDLDGYFNNLIDSNVKLITEPAKNVFVNKQFPCVEYEDLTADQEREIFQSVHLCDIPISINTPTRLCHKAQRPSAIRWQSRTSKTQDVAAKFQTQLKKQSKKRRQATYQAQALSGLKGLGKGRQATERLDGPAVQKRGKRVRQEVDERLILPAGTRRKVKKPSREPLLVSSGRRF